MNYKNVIKFNPKLFHFWKFQIGFWNEFFQLHSYPKWEFEIKNVSEVWCIFLKSKLYDSSKKHFLKILGLAQSPLDPHIFCKKHPRKICQKVDLHYFSISFSKNHSKCLKTAIFPLEIDIQNTYNLQKQMWLGRNLFFCRN